MNRSTLFHVSLKQKQQNCFHHETHLNKQDTFPFFPPFNMISYEKDMQLHVLYHSFFSLSSGSGNFSATDSNNSRSAFNFSSGIYVFSSYGTPGCSRNSLSFCSLFSSLEGLSVTPKR